MKRIVQAGVFKAKCLKIMEEVGTYQCDVVITKHNKPIAKLVPIEKTHLTLFGQMKGTLHIKGDLTKPIGEEWDACS